MPVLGTQVIKSIQRGTTVLSAGGTTNVAINSVDMDKSFLSSSVASGYGAGNLSGNSGDGNAASSFVMGGFIGGATSLSFAAGSYRAYNTSYATSSTQIYWEVIEYV
tara:strand:+ start:232 stop:552 length:321 start_codon:yes stop_codon:yes gene_type:complete